MTMQEKTRTRINQNGRVVIPASFRKALGINIGDEVVLRIEDEELRISTLKRGIERAQRLVRRHSPFAADAFWAHLTARRISVEHTFMQTTDRV